MDSVSSLSIGPRGPIALPNSDFFQKIGHFSRERTLERVNSALGNGAFGYFVCRNSSLPHLTQAALFSRYGEKTDLIVRLTSAGRPGGADLSRGIHAISFKFFTKQGNWDLTNLDIPMFSIHDSLRLTDIMRIRDASLEPFLDYARYIPQARLSPLLFDSDTAMIDGWRRMEGHSLNTYRFDDRKGRYTYVRFKFDPLLEFNSFHGEEIVRIRGTIPDYYQRDLYTAIERGDYPRWLMKAQLMSKEEAQKAKFNVFDPSKVREC